MKINYWNCEYHDAEEVEIDGDWTWVYECRHPSGTGYCKLDNKWCGEEDNCKLIDERQ